MIYRWRAFAVLWVCGFFYAALSTGSGPFHWIGVSTMDVFNRRSLQAAQWRVVYFNDGKRLPFMSYEGDNLRWMDDENLKYRTYLGVGFGLGSVGDVSLASLKKKWPWLSQQLLRPVIYDFCYRKDGSGSYTIDLKHQTESAVRVRLNWKVDPLLKQKCPSLQLAFTFNQLTEESALLPAQHIHTLTPMGLFPN